MAGNMHVRDVQCSTPRQFIEAISPLGPYFERSCPSDDWNFRGHGNDRYQLVPRALRSNEVEELHRLAQTDPRIRPKSEINVSPWHSTTVCRHGS